MLADALELSSDYMMDGSLKDKVKSMISDKKVLSQFQQVEKLPGEKNCCERAYLCSSDEEEDAASAPHVLTNI